MNKYLVKLAASKKKEDTSGSKAVAGTGVALMGASDFASQRGKGDLTGRRTLYHGTSIDTAKKIRKEGLKPQSVTQTAEGATQKAGINPALLKKNEGRVFLATNKNFAKNIRAKTLAQVKQARKGTDVVTASIPDWKDKSMKRRKNPEVPTLKGNLNFMLMPKPEKDNLKTLLSKGTYVVKGDVPTKYLKGSSDYQKLSASEIKEYISKNKKRALKGYGRAIAGAGTVAGGLGFAADQTLNKSKGK